MSKTERALDELDTEFDDEFELELDMDAPARALDRYDADDIDDDDVNDFDELPDDLGRPDAIETDDLPEVVEQTDDSTDDSIDLGGELLVDTAVDVDDVDDVDDVEQVDAVDQVGDVAAAEPEADEVLEHAGLDDEVVENRGESDLDTVNDDILEELRRADIDGPIVDLAPQDDTTSARRRPKRAMDFDPAPMPIPTSAPLLLGRKPRVRRVTRVVRHVDPWSVFKIAAIANLVLYVILLTAGVLLWNVANATGTVDNVERFFESFGWNTFEFNGGEIYHSAWIGGLFLVVGFTGLAVLAATLFNLITDLVGGMRLTVLEEEVVETRTSPMRRFVVRRPEPVVPAVVHDDESGPIIREAVVDDESKGLPF